MKFLTGPEIWERIAQLARRSGPACVAVPYLGKGAAKMLPLRRGSVLVTRFELSAIRAGQVCPADVIALLKAGVRVFNQPSLHAKVYVFSHGVVIGSSNASKTSRDRLVEACIETNDLTIVSKAKRFVIGQAQVEIDLESARPMLEEYREPVGFPMAGESSTKRMRRSVRPDEISERPLWLIPLYVRKSLPPSFAIARDAAERGAKKELNGENDGIVDVFRCPANMKERLEVGDIMLLRSIDKDAGVDKVGPPARILSFQKERGVNWFAVAYSIRNRARSRMTGAVAKKLGERATQLVNLKRAKRPASREDRTALLGLWPVKPG